VQHDVPQHVSAAPHAVPPFAQGIGSHEPLQ
jgi:hypothetical protein